jgi:hypothetical protein
MIAPNETADSLVAPKIRLICRPTNLCSIAMSTMRDKARLARLLQKNPQQPAPALPKASLTVATLHRYKDRLRAYDAARQELKLASPEQIQAENSAVGKAFRPRIVRFSQHA